MSSPNHGKHDSPYANILHDLAAEYNGKLLTKFSDIKSLIRRHHSPRFDQHKNESIPNTLDEIEITTAIAYFESIEAPLQRLSDQILSILDHFEVDPSLKVSLELRRTELESHVNEMGELYKLLISLNDDSVSGGKDTIPDRTSFDDEDEERESKCFDLTVISSDKTNSKFFSAIYQILDGQMKKEDIKAIYKKTPFKLLGAVSKAEARKAADMLGKLNFNVRTAIVPSPLEEEV